MTWKFTPLDIYFHMTNHYRKLRSVRGVIDTSPPTCYCEKMQGTRHSRPPSRAEKRRQPVSVRGGPHKAPYNYQRQQLKRLPCIDNDNSPNRSQSLPPRPLTRRKLSEEVPGGALRARSTGVHMKSNDATTHKARSARSQRCGKSPSGLRCFTRVTQEQATPMLGETILGDVSTSVAKSSKCKTDAFYKKSVSDNDYLQFSLRITEDIIRNDLYTNKEMHRVFNSHIAANLGRLEMGRMIEQIDDLCAQLGIPLDVSDEYDSAKRPQIKARVPTALTTCFCDIITKPLNGKLPDCECSSIRSLPFKCSQHANKTLLDDKNGTSVPLSNVSENGSIPVPKGISTQSINFVENVVKTHYYEDKVNLEKWIVFDTPVESTENELVVKEDESQCYIEFPSLSCVTEKTEPTSSFSLDNKIEELKTNPSYEETTTMEKLQNKKSEISNATTYLSQSSVLAYCSSDVSYSIKEQQKSEPPISHDSSVQTHSILTENLESSLFQVSSVNVSLCESKNVPNKAPEMIKGSCISRIGTNSEYQLLELKETSNVKVYGLNKQEEELVLYPGPIYVAKSSVVTVNKQKAHICSDTKDVQQTFINPNWLSESICSITTKCPTISTVSSCVKSNITSEVPGVDATYSQVHDAALNTIHCTSFVSDLSRPADMAIKSPTLDHQLLSDKMEYIARPPITNANARSDYKKQQVSAVRIAQLNDYDLTPQRDIPKTFNRTCISKCTRKCANIPVVNRDSLLLGDEYEIKNTIMDGPPISDCYANRLPHSISRFYPNMSTQTQSSDWLPNIGSSIGQDISEVIRPVYDMVSNNKISDSLNALSSYAYLQRSASQLTAMILTDNDTVSSSQDSKSPNGDATQQKKKNKSAKIVENIESTPTKEETTLESWDFIEGFPKINPISESNVKNEYITREDEIELKKADVILNSDKAEISNKDDAVRQVDWSEDNKEPSSDEKLRTYQSPSSILHTIKTITGDSETLRDAATILSTQEQKDDIAQQQTSNAFIADDEHNRSSLKIPFQSDYSPLQNSDIEGISITCCGLRKQKQQSLRKTPIQQVGERLNGSFSNNNMYSADVKKLGQGVASQGKNLRFDAEQFKSNMESGIGTKSNAKVAPSPSQLASKNNEMNMAIKSSVSFDNHISQTSGRFNT